MLAFDPEQGNQILDQIGWVSDGAGSRAARGIPGVEDNTPLRIRFQLTPTNLHLELAEKLAVNLAECGISLEIETLPAAELYAPWPDGPVFGQRFETVGWAWPNGVSPLCEMFSSQEIPSQSQPLGINASGFNSEEYDQTCSTILLSHPENQNYVDAARRSQQIFNQEMPALSLYMRPRVVAHVVDLCGVAVDPTAHSVLWNIESLSKGDCLEDE
jgi:peptide/nickel transport system substrate-binding protein